MHGQPTTRGRPCASHVREHDREQMCVAAQGLILAAKTAFVVFRWRRTVALVPERGSGRAEG